MGRKRKAAATENDDTLVTEDDDNIVNVTAIGGVSPLSVDASNEDFPSLHKEELVPSLTTTTNEFSGIVSGNDEGKNTTAPFMNLGSHAAGCAEDFTPPQLQVEAAPEAVESKEEVIENIPEDSDWKVGGIELVTNEREWKESIVVEVSTDATDWKESVVVETIPQESDWKEDIVICTKNDTSGMVDLSVVEGIPLVGDGKLLLHGEHEGMRKDFSMQEMDDAYYSPPKESFVLTLAENNSPLIGDLVVVHDHEANAFVNPILVDNDEARDATVRGGLDRTALRCHEHTLKLEEWKLTRKQKELVCRAGFGHFIKIGSFTLDKQHITALVERWNKETNTFHLPVGEMTITLDEVAINLGLAIDGDPVVAVSGKDETVGSMCTKYLGKTPSTSDKKGGFLKLGWLKDSFSICPEDAPHEKLEQHTRAYLLYLVGSTIFSTTTGNTVPVLYLPLFEDFDRAGKYAWGAAALAFLYRSLSNASSRAQNTISGCLTLLQCWSYLHLDIRRPRLSEKANLDVFPLAMRWKQKQSGHRTKWSVLQYQNALDSLQLYDVEWMPYKSILSIVPDDMKGSLILGKSKTTLLCLDKAEKHNPDRCLRQFGMPQPIPETVPLLKDSDGEARQTESKDLSHGEWLERRERIVEEDSGVDDEEYAEWYLKFSRNVRRKTSLEDVYQQTVIGLTKMLELAETLTRDDMPTKNKEVVRNITNTLSESLREVVSVMASPQKGV